MGNGGRRQPPTMSEINVLTRPSSGMGQHHLRISYHRTDIDKPATTPPRHEMEAKNRSRGTRGRSGRVGTNADRNDRATLASLMKAVRRHGLLDYLPSPLPSDLPQRNLVIRKFLEQNAPKRWPGKSEEEVGTKATERVRKVQYS